VRVGGGTAVDVTDVQKCVSNVTLRFHNFVTFPDDGSVTGETCNGDRICAVFAYDGFVNKHEMDYTYVKVTFIHSFIHSFNNLTTGPTPLPKRFLHIVRSRVSSFKWE
jgi:hypothetical protein